MLETNDEQKLVTHVENLGCLCLKLNPLGISGLPDRLVIGMRRFIMFIEMKRKVGGEVSPIQSWVHKQLAAYGFEVTVANGYDEAITAFDDQYSKHLKNAGVL